MNKVDTLIIGAGISGLTYGSYCKEDYLIVEKEERPGGLCKTFYQDGFVWDYAGHFFHFANSNIKELFEKKVRKEDMVKCNKNTNINYGGHIITYPFQMNIHQLEKKEFIDCLYDLFHRSEKSMYFSFQDMLYGKFGVSITEKFLKPYNEKLYACNLDELDPDAMGRFFPYADPEQIINNMKNNNTQTYNSTFDYPRQGAQFFVDIILENIDKKKLMLNSTVEFIDTKNKIAVINGENYIYKKIVNTTPLNSFIKILPEQDIKDIQGYLSCNKVLVFNLGFNKPAIDSNTHWTYFPMKDINFYRVGYYSNILKTDRLSMYIEIGFKEKDIINIEEQLSNTIYNLKKLGIITDHKLISYNKLIINPAYVHITEQSIKKVESFKKSMKKKDIYTLGRYGRWTYCSIEDCMIEAMETALKNRLFW